MKLSKRVGTMAVVIDEAAEKAEFLNSDTIGIVGFIVNTISGLAHISLAFGGVDSKGIFHVDMNRSNEIANITITREKNPDLFDPLFCPQGQLKCDFPKEFFDRLTKDVLLPVAYNQVWGGKYPELQVVQNGEILFDGAIRSAPGAVS